MVARQSGERAHRRAHRRRTGEYLLAATRKDLREGCDADGREARLQQSEDACLRLPEQQGVVIIALQETIVFCYTANWAAVRCISLLHQDGEGYLPSALRSGPYQVVCRDKQLLSYKPSSRYTIGARADI